MIADGRENVAGFAEAQCWMFWTIAWSRITSPARMVATKVGLAASNVLRHAGSREELFLDVMDEQYVAWIAELAAELNRLGTPASIDAVATLVASSLVGRTTLHQLIEASPELLRHTASGSGARNRAKRCSPSTRSGPSVIWWQSCWRV